MLLPTGYVLVLWVPGTLLIADKHLLLAFCSRFTGLLWSLGSARREIPLRHTALGSCHPLANYKYEFDGTQAWVLRGRDTEEHPHPCGFVEV